MKINNEHPEFIKFIKNEFRTLEFIKDQPCLNASFPELNSYVHQFYCINHNRINKVTANLNIDFEAKFKLSIDGEDRTVFLGVNLGSNFSHVSYMLSFCESSDEEDINLIRKFHFDYEINTGDTYKPVYHLQYGGKLTPFMLESKAREDHIYSWLSIPRINFVPINLALLLDFIFIEFKNDVTDKITEKSEWRDFIKMNEDFLLKDYYKTINGFFSREHSSKNLFRDFSYGK